MYFSKNDTTSNSNNLPRNEKILDPNPTTSSTLITNAAIVSNNVTTNNITIPLNNNSTHTHTHTYTHSHSHTHPVILNTVIGESKNNSNIPELENNEAVITTSTIPALVEIEDNLPIINENTPMMNMNPVENNVQLLNNININEPNPMANPLGIPMNSIPKADTNTMAMSDTNTMAMDATNTMAMNGTNNMAMAMSDANSMAMDSNNVMAMVNTNTMAMNGTNNMAMAMSDANSMAMDSNNVMAMVNTNTIAELDKSNIANAAIKAADNFVIDVDNAAKNNNIGSAAAAAINAFAASGYTEFFKSDRFNCDCENVNYCDLKDYDPNTNNVNEPVASNDDKNKNTLAEIEKNTNNEYQQNNNTGNNFVNNNNISNKMNNEAINSKMTNLNNDSSPDPSVDEANNRFNVNNIDSNALAYNYDKTGGNENQLEIIII